MSTSTNNVTCLFCGAEIENGKGHNPEPFYEKEDGLCCDECKEFYITPALQGDSDLAYARYSALVALKLKNARSLADLF